MFHYFPFLLFFIFYGFVCQEDYVDVKITRVLQYSTIFKTPPTYSGSANPGARLFPAIVNYPNLNKAYLVGGYGTDEGYPQGNYYYDSMNDVWEFDYSTEEWTYLRGCKCNQGSQVDDGLDAYWAACGGADDWKCSGCTSGPSIEPSPRFPGRERVIPMKHSDNTKFYLFGGVGYGFWKYEKIAWNEVWEYTIGTNTFARLSGAPDPKETWDGNSEGNEWCSTNAPNPGSEPGARAEATAFEPSGTTKRYVFGGYLDNYRSWNDLWAYDVSDNSWERMHPIDFNLESFPCRDEDLSAGVGVFSDTLIPSARSSYFSWSIRLPSEDHDRFYIFGGFDNCLGLFLNDLWRYDYVLNQFMLIKDNGGDYYQSTANYYYGGMYHKDNNPGGRYRGVSFVWQNTDDADKFYLGMYGGLGLAQNGPGLLNDVWVFSTSEDNWSYRSNLNTVNHQGKGSAYPSSRFGVSSLQKSTDEGSDVFIFGGTTYYQQQINFIGDVWTLNFEKTCNGAASYREDACYGHGFCYDDNSCSCEPDYEYDHTNCQTYKLRCGGYTHDDEEVCNKKGSCIEDELCSCGSGWYGQFCEERYDTEEGTIYLSENDETIARDYLLFSVIVPDELISSNITCESLFVSDEEIENTVGMFASCNFTKSGLAAYSNNYHDGLEIFLSQNHKLTRSNDKIHIYAVSRVLNSNLISNSPITLVITSGFADSNDENYAILVVKNTVPYIAAIFVVVCCILCCCFCICGVFAYRWFVKKLFLDKANKLKHLELIKKEQELLVGDIKELEWDKEMFNIDWKDISLVEVISGLNSNAIVYRARWNGKKVAVKVYKTKDFSTQDQMDEFEKEVKVLKNMDHPNILKYFGSSIDPPNICIVQELCENGDLRKYVENIENERLGIGDKLRLLKEIAASMQHIHDKNIIHRDLKPDNILLDSKLSAKLIDFGLSRIVEGATQVYLTKQAGTSQYMAPEVTLSSRYGGKCDIFSFAMILFELLTENFSPYGEILNFNVELKVALNPDFRPKIDQTRYAMLPYLYWYIQMMTSCWDVDPENRMEFSEIITIIEENEEKTVALWEENNTTEMIGLNDQKKFEDFIEELEKKYGGEFEKTDVIEKSRERAEEKKDDLDVDMESFDFDI